MRCPLVILMCTQAMRGNSAAASTLALPAPDAGATSTLASPPIDDVPHPRHALDISELRKRCIHHGANPKRSAFTHAQLNECRIPIDRHSCH